MYKENTHDIHRILLYTMIISTLILVSFVGECNAFTPSTAVHEVQTFTQTSKSYTNGDLSQFANCSISPQEQQQSTLLQQTNNIVNPFDIWGKMRLGLGSGPGSNADGVFWVGGGSLYEPLTGEILAIFEGYDIGKGIQINDNHIRQLSRKIFWFRDPITGDIMKEYNGQPVKPIVYDSQMIDYHRGEDGSITYSVEASLRLLKGALPKMKITSQFAGPHQMMINIPVFLDVPIPADRGGGRYQAWEFYDYNVDPSFENHTDRPPTAVWCRQGSVPPFNMDSKSVLRFSGHRVDNYDELPERMRIEVEREYPHFKGPPKDEEEAIDQAYSGKR